MEVEEKVPEAPDVFLKVLGEGLQATEGVDADIARILATHILKAAPAPNAVAEAKDAIVKLAAQRANPPMVEVVVG